MARGFGNWVRREAKLLAVVDCRAKNNRGALEPHTRFRKTRKMLEVFLRRASYERGVLRKRGVVAVEGIEPPTRGL